MDDYSKTRIKLNDEVSVALYCWDKKELSIEADGIGGCYLCSSSSIDINVDKEKAIKLIAILTDFLTPPTETGKDDRTKITANMTLHENGDVDINTPITIGKDDHQSTSNPVDNQISGDMSDKVVGSKSERTTQDDSERVECPDLFKDKGDE